MKTNKVFIATSLDGYIADQNGGIEWLHSTPNPEQDDMGYSAFMEDIDAIIMGRKTYETVLGFDIDWPYQVPVFVLSATLKTVPQQLQNKVFILNDTLNQVLKTIHQLGYHQLYIDGGTTISNFLKENLIDEMTITIIPILLGSGIPLFREQEQSVNFKCVDSRIYLQEVVQNKFIKT